ncbi:putative type II DNA modification enzyme (Methyltransferase) 1 [Helicobacter pylori Hp P-4d]|uniref:Putative type II DNA modification enzyme (Methyltransferase) 1 n=1 Tax=Helicobacter pylori Hp P-4 TaxID=992075 RepID=J0PY31_HELPX|nr:putative type II DNA modification enzyme (Methyltransferase) 1 [Helicobacter pylori Hp P-4]EJC24186.1 putative type II DNA modification enzyme (Methyltransferase) 1 [Helicobacter pylori Hp P-4c]EJC25401.1 putative type II DNA modification enzyme (Methyltransferase) 1 [Helicobacter pylori Hp P-4d]
MDYKKLDLPNTNHPNQEQLKDFETAFNAFLETNQQENEDHHKDAFNDLLKGAFKYKVKPTKKIDSAILNDNDKVEVIIEFKALKSPNEFIKKGDLNVKALHESLLYYLIERKEGNNNLKRLILGTIKELYIIDANEFEVFNKDKEIQKAFENCHDKKGNDPRTKAFYDACQKRLNELDHSLKYHHIPLKKENLALIYQALSPNFLLKIPKYSDANTLNKDFYEELLYILGLEEKNEKGKTLIKPSRTQNSLSDALKNNTKI